MSPAVTIVLLVVAFLLIITGLFMLLKTPNMMKIIIAVEIAMKAVTLLMIFAGVQSGHVALSQSLIVTMIVLEAVVAVVAIGIAVSLYRHHGDMNISRLNKLKG